MQNDIINFVEVEKNQLDGVFGLSFPSLVTISADGKFLYVAATDNSFTTELNESAIAIFERDQTTGKLRFVAAQQDIDGLTDAYAIAISPDDHYLYVAGRNESAIAYFQRDTNTGELIFIATQQDDLLSGLTDIAISADGRFLYAIASAEGTEQDGIAIFERDPITGGLTPFDFLPHDPNQVDGLAGAYSLILSADNRFLYVSGIVDETTGVLGVFERDLDNGELSFVEAQTGYTDSIDVPFIPYSLALSPDHQYLYGLGTSGVIGVFARDTTTGTLSLVELQEDAAAETDGIGGVKAISISPDGKFLYAAIFQDDGVAVFQRDITTGKLTFREFQQDETNGVDGLDGIFSVVTSPDSKFIYTAGFADSAVTVFSQNVVPTSADTNIYTQPNSLYSFKPSDFPFIDADSDDSLHAVTIITLPQLGEFFLDSNNDQQLTEGEQINVGQIIAVEQLNLLKFKTDKTAIGNNYAQFQFKVSDGAEDSLAANQLTINVQGTVIINSQNDIFTVKNSDSSKSQLEFQLTKLSPSIIYELGVFRVDDAQGNLNGIAPGTTDYTRTALTTAQVILFSLANSPNGFNPLDLTRTLEFNSGENLRFYLIPNSTTNAVLSGNTNLSTVIFLNNENIQVENEGFLINYADFGVRIQTRQQALPLGINSQAKHQGEVIDLRGINQAVRADFILNREAVFDNLIGFYRVVDENGGIDTNGDGTADILVGQSGYTQAAVRGRISGMDFRVSNQSTATYTGIFEPGGIYAPLIIVNGLPDAVIDQNRNNDPRVYFPFLGANPDQADHIHLLGNNTFGFEDLFNGGDRDYNDVIVRVNLSLT
ncbi:beta-propeller fold lactonase family protein [Aliinostoc sp. HNIBRCY26]|uniref:beta-propeller fold lactonase family protein n=1 Tax=Aliinostoc sp. HNIBRCY26 TaxID=3418997 RepID=UPI003D01357F